jgi:hypothetical protein
MKVWFSVFALIALFSSSAHAESQISLSNFGSFSDEGALQMDTNGWENFSADLALVVHPKFGGPAATLGGRGIDFGYQLSVVDIEESSDHWTKAMKQPDDLLMAHHFYVRKGLPFSIELGGVLTHLQGTNIWAVALELKWAFLEGNKYAPDFGFRTHVNTLLGNRDMVMITTGGELLVSKTFGLGGLVQLTPYAGYELNYAHTRSHVLGLFEDGSLTPRTFILPSQDVLTHRALLGLRLLASVVDFGFEAGLGNVQSYTFKFGINI